jgi:Fur family ferric uptake transcriptional regulator
MNINNMKEQLRILQDHLAEKGFKRTQQRETILEVFLQAKKHLTIEELHSLVRYRDPSVGLTTVYRTMKLFCDCQLARANHFEEGITRYEQQFQTAHHDHMICLKCGETIEFVDDRIEELQVKVAKKFSFKMTDHRMEIFGLCSKCQQSRVFSSEELL